MNDTVDAVINFRLKDFPLTHRPAASVPDWTNSWRTMQACGSSRAHATRPAPWQQNRRLRGGYPCSRAFCSGLESRGAALVARCPRAGSGGGGVGPLGASALDTALQQLRLAGQLAV